MSQKATAVTIILIVLIIIILGVAGGVFYLLQNEKLKAQDLESKLDSLNKKQIATESELFKSRNMISDLQFKLDESKSQIQTLSADLELQKKDSQESFAKMEQLKIDLAEQKQLRLDLENKFNTAQDEIRKALVQIKTLNTQKDTLETKVNELEAKSQEVELGKIIVSPDDSLISGAKRFELPTVSVMPGKTPQILGLEGKVLVINKEYNFVVINLGAKDGVAVGDEFSIFHINKFVGDVKIEKVHESMAAAGFQTSDLKDSITEGDKVVQKVR